MQILRDPATYPRPERGTVVTIGAYDGVHLGHAGVIQAVKALADERSLATAVVTFDRHPASVVRPDSAPLLLTDLEQKLELLESTGIDYTMVVHFDEARSKEPAEDFVSDDLVGCLNAKVIVVGEDFHFGHKRAGNVELLRAMGETLDFEVVPLDLVGIDGVAAVESEQVSSTAIRAMLREGNLDRANEFLGRAYEVRGVVGDGDKRARDLGFPTANVNVADQICLPRDGIYAGWYITQTGERNPCAISLGRRPTFYESQPYSLLEAHLLDFSGDLYGTRARVQFVKRLRDERRFESVEGLVEAMQGDCEQARRVLLGPTKSH